MAMRGSGGDGIGLEGKKMIDISIVLGKEAMIYPGDPPYRRELLQSHAASDPCDASELQMGLHCGTHLDFPRHFIAGGKTLADYKVSDFVFDAYVIETAGDGLISPTDLDAAQTQPGDALLFKTENSRCGRATHSRFDDNYVALSLAAAQLCVERRLGLVGIDYASIERSPAGTFPVHHELLSNELLILEGLSLSDVSPGKYQLICLPLALDDGEASPTRAVLVSP
jgi:arylformamidase